MPLDATGDTEAVGDTPLVGETVGLTAGGNPVVVGEPVVGAGPSPTQYAEFGSLQLEKRQSGFDDGQSPVNGAEELAAGLTPGGLFSSPPQLTSATELRVTATHASVDSPELARRVTEAPRDRKFRTFVLLSIRPLFRAAAARILLRVITSRVLRTPGTSREGVRSDPTYAPERVDPFAEVPAHPNFCTPLRPTSGARSRPRLTVPHADRASCLGIPARIPATTG